MSEGMIKINSDFGKELGFTSDKFNSSSYLWRKANDIYISFIMSEKRGNFRALCETLLAKGLTIKVPTPLGRMLYIMVKEGYTHTWEMSEEGAFECWVKGQP